MKKILFVFLMAFSCLSTWAQKLTVSGTVTDQTGPLVGVTIKVQGLNTGAVTDLDGHYTISAPKNATIVYSYVGYNTVSKKVKDDAPLNIQMQETVNDVDEVVVTAIGIKQEKRKLGYTTQQVKGEKIAASGALNAAGSLSGQVAGLTVSNPSGMYQTTSFSLRGATPLIVLDGVPVESDFYDISSDNIESINVLKGTAASALYGSRGKNGAIMITTKQAKNKGVEVQFSTKNMLTAGFIAYPKTQHQYGSGSKGQYEFWDGEGGGKSDDDMEWGPKLDVGNTAPQWNSPIRDKQTGETIPWWGSVKGTKYDDKSRYERVAMPLTSHDNLHDFLRTGFITNNNISLAYKGDKASVDVVGQYAYQLGQAPSTSIYNGGLNMNSSFNISDKLNLQATMDYNMMYTPNYPDYGYHPSNFMYSIVEWMGDDINGKELKEHLWVPGMEGYRQANYNYAWYNNPYFALEMARHNERRNVFTGQLKLLYQLLPNLTLMARASMRDNDTNKENKIPKSYMNYGDSREGDYKVWNIKQRNVDADFLATYTTPLVGDISMTLNAGGSVFYKTYRNDYATTDGLNIPGVYSLTNSTGAILTYNSSYPLYGYRYKKEIRSLYASANFDLSKYAFLTVTGRNDWSSTLASGNNSYFYPSVSLSSVVSDYVKLPKFISYLKLRTSWAQVSSDLDPYEIEQVYEKLTSWGTTSMVQYPNSLINPQIKPQKTSSFEAGFNIGFLNRLALDFTYYRNVDTNQILDMLISSASGYDSRKINGNTYTTNGIEMMINAEALRLRDFRWNVSLNMSHSVKKLSKIYGDAEYFGDLKKGDRADSYYTTVWQRTPDGTLIVDATGQPIKDPYKRNVGHYNPNLRYGLQNTFKYKDFTLNIDMDGAFGGVLYSTLSPKLWWGGKHPESVEYRDVEYASGKPVYVPDAVVVTGGEVKYDINGNIVSDTRTYAKNSQAVDWQSWCQNYPYRAVVTDKMDKKFANVFSRTYLKIRYVSLAYDFHKLLRGNRYIKGLTANIFVNNLALFAKAPWIDPDISGDDGSNNGANDPTARYIGIGATIKF